MIALIITLIVSLIVTFSPPQSSSPFERINILRFRQVDQGVWAGGRPGQAGLEELAAAGIRTVIDLEGGWWHNPTDTVAAEERAARALGMNFISLPMHPWFVPKAAQVDSALKLMRDPSLQPVYVHCNHGKDRTGIVEGAYRVCYQGWTPDQAFAEMLQNGFNRYFLYRWKTFFFRYAAAILGQRRAAA